MNVTFGSNQKGTEEMTLRVLELEILHAVTNVQFHCFTFVFRIKIAHSLYWWALKCEDHLFIT